jgi:hypothetical protein
MCDENSCGYCLCRERKASAAVKKEALAALAEASKMWRVRHVKTGRYLSVSSWREELQLTGGRFDAVWQLTPGLACGSWDKQAALGLAKFWIALTGDMDVEIKEVKP